VTIHFCLLVYQIGVLEKLWDSFVICWGYWELQIINYCLQFINVFRCMIYITGWHQTAIVVRFVGFTPQSSAQWRRWRVRLMMELTGAHMMVSQLLKNFPYLLKFQFNFLVHKIHHHTEPYVPAPHPSNLVYLTSVLISRVINTLIFQETSSFRFSKQFFLWISYLFYKDASNAQQICLFMIATLQNCNIICHMVSCVIL
jgi:hypothetical protein